MVTMILFMKTLSLLMAGFVPGVSSEQEMRLQKVLIGF